MLILSACQPKSQIINIDDVSKDTIFEFNLNYNPHGKINIHAKGEVDDSIRINNINLKGGKIDTIFQQDWYTEQVSLPYYSIGAKNGNLLLTVK